MSIQMCTWKEENCQINKICIYAEIHFKSDYFPPPASLKYSLHFNPLFDI